MDTGLICLSILLAGKSLDVILNRIVYPVIDLNSIDEIDKFIDAKTKWKENTAIFTQKYNEKYDAFNLMERSVRVVVFISQPNDFEEELFKLVSSALSLNSRSELRVARVIKPDIVSQYKQRKGDKFFVNNTSNLIALGKHNKADPSPTKFYVSDISAKNLIYSTWINEKSIEQVEELNIYTFKIINFIKKPFFVTFLSNATNASSFKSSQTLGFLKQIASETPSIQVLYTYNDFYKSRKAMFGITWSSDPSLSFVKK